MIIMYLKEKCVFCIRINSVVFFSFMGNIMKIDWYILCKFENVVNIFFEIFFDFLKIYLFCLKKKFKDFEVFMKYLGYNFLVIFLGL